MKYLSLTLLVLCLIAKAHAQELSDLKNDYKRYPSSAALKAAEDEQIKLLAPSAFDKFLTDQYSFVLLGSQTPATGLKFETSSPSITLKGNIIAPKNSNWIVSLELTGGVKNGLSEIFSQNKLSGYFKSSIGINRLLGKNCANFDQDNSQILYHIRSRAIDQYEALVAARDTMHVLLALTDSKTTTTVLTWEDFKTVYIEAVLKNESKAPKKNEMQRQMQMIAANEKPSKSDELERQQRIQELLDKTHMERIRKITVGLINTVFRDTETDPNKCLASYHALWNDGTDADHKKMQFLKRYKKFTAMDDKFVDSLHRYELGEVKDLWTMHHIHWLNFLPNISNTSFSTYNAANAVIDPRQSFLYGAKLSYNGLYKFKESHRYTYWTVGLSAQKVNTLEEMMQYVYKSSTQIKPNGTESLTKEETGTGYEGTFAEGFGYSFAGALYYSPWRHGYIPGLYTELGYNHGKPWITKDKVAVSLGLTWNVTSSDKDAKNLLTIVPYVKWSNILKEYKDPTLAVTPTHDLFSIGLMVGIPINIGK